MIGSALGQMVGRQFGTYLGRQLALGACREDRDDDLERRPFQPTLSGGQIPSAVDLRPWMTPVENQGRLGSCAANALVGGAEYLLRRETGQHIDLSRLFVYFGQRLWDDAVRDDLGAAIGDGVRVMSRLGVPTEAMWPYHEDLFAVQPTEPVLKEALTFKIADWWSVPVNPDAFRGCLAAGFPIAFGTKVTESFVQTPRTGICGMPQGADDRRHGRHALLAVGYDDRHRVFVVRNSWGDDWGDGGYVYMPYQYVLNPQWTSGCWALRLTDRDAFDPGQHGGTNLAQLPKAPPSGSGGAQAAGTVASMGAQVAVGAFTGSGLLAGLAGGLISGLTPGVTKALQGKDKGAFADVDRSEWMINVLQGDGPTPARFARLGFDDGLDEEAIVQGISPASARRPVRASGRQPGGTASGAASSTGASSNLANVVGGAAAAATVIPSMFTSGPPAPAPSGGGAPPGPAWGGAPGGRAVKPPTPTPAPSMELIEKLPAHLADWWRRDGGVKGPLGAPLAPPEEMSEGHFHGVAVRFEDGVMCAWNPPPGQPRPEPLVLLARKETVAKWLALGGGASMLGWPVGPAKDDGMFEILPCLRGSVLQHPSYGAHPVQGAIFALWRSLGGPNSDLGAPTEDPSIPDDPRQPTSQTFENGTLFWSAARGAWRG